jgi:uncharacterized membrane protein
VIKHIAIILAAIYPLAVYFGLAYFSPALLGMLLAALLIARLAPELKSASARMGDYHVLLPILLLIAYSVLIACFDSRFLLRGYPVLINLMMFWFFASSLAAEQTLIEKIARAAGQTINSQRKFYMQRLTIVWSVFLACNTLVAAYTAVFSTLAVWAWYNGLVSYLLIAALLLGERIFRSFYRARLARNGALPP